LLKWLGVALDSELHLSQFIKATCKSTFLTLRNLCGCRESLTQKTMKLLCNSLILSKIDYCNSLLVNVPKNEIHRLQKAINFAARLVTRRKRNCNITPILEELGWYKMEDRIRYKISCLTFTVLHSGKPDYLNKYLRIYVPTRQLRSGNKNVLVQENAKLKIGEGSIGFSGPKIWNSLPETVRLSRNYSIFTYNLHKHLHTIS